MTSQQVGTGTGERFRVRRILKRSPAADGFAAPRGSGHISIFMVVMMCVGLSIAATFGEFAVGVLAPAFERELHAEPSQLGLLMAVMFTANAVIAIPAGVLADRVDPRKTILMQVVICALAFGSIALVTEASQLFISAAAIGAIMSLNPSMTNRIVVDFVPVQHRAMAVAWKSVGLQVSGLLVGLTFGLTESFSHWRTTTVGVVVLLIAMGLLMHLRFRRAEPLRMRPVATVTEAVDRAEAGGSAASSVPSLVETNGSAPADASSATSSSSRSEAASASTISAKPARERIAEPIVWWLIPYCLFTTGAFTCVAAYLVLYGTTEVGVSPAAAASASGIAAGISIAARFIWVKWLTRKNEALMLGIAAFSSAVSISVLAISPYFGEAGFWFATVLIGLTLMGSSPIQHVVLVQNANPRYIGRVSSAVGIAISLSLAGMPFVIAFFIDGLGLRATWWIVIGIMLVGVFTMVLFSITRAVQRRRTLEEPAGLVA